MSETSVPGCSRSLRKIFFSFKSQTCKMWLSMTHWNQAENASLRHGALDYTSVLEPNGELVIGKESRLRGLSKKFTKSAANVPRWAPCSSAAAPATWASEEGARPSFVSRRSWGQYNLNTNEKHHGLRPRI